MSTLLIPFWLVATVTGWPPMVPRNVLYGYELPFSTHTRSPRLLIAGLLWSTGSMVSWPRVEENIWFLPLAWSYWLHTTSPREFMETLPPTPLATRSGQGPAPQSEEVVMAYEIGRAHV